MNNAMIKKSIIFLILLGIIFSGCTNKVSKEEDQKIVIWHWMTDRQSAFEELAAKYEDSYGIRIDFQYGKKYIGYKRNSYTKNAK